jgi:hypothetical protein
MIYDQWWTKKTDSITDSNGKTSFGGFLGTYKYTVSAGEKERSGSFTILNSNQSGKQNSLVLSFDTSIPDNFGITASKPTVLCEGEDIMLSAPLINDAVYQWFNGSDLLSDQTDEIVVKESGNYFVKAVKGTLELFSDTLEVMVNPLPEAIITAEGDLSFCPGGKVTLNANTSNDLTYNWLKGSTKIQGSVTSIEVSESGSYSLQTNSKGCIAVSEPVVVEVFSASNPECTIGIDDLKYSVRVYPNPFNGYFIIEPRADGFSNTQIELFDMLGSRVIFKDLEQNITETVIHVDTPGVYSLRIQNIDGERIKYDDSTYITDLLTEHTLQWLDAGDKTKPFFVYLSHKAVHAGFQPAKRHKGKYKNKIYALPPTFDQTKTGVYRELKWPEWVANQRISWHGVDYMYNSNSDLNTMVQDYCETLLAVDESIGSVMEYLKKEGIDESTLVIYMGDNGFSWGEHGLIDKRHFYEESVKVPFLVRCPELFEGGKVIEKMVQNVDIAPTCLEMAGLKKPAEMRGFSFVQLLKGNETEW